MDIITTSRNEIIKIICNYNYIDSLIKKREIELEAPFDEFKDENVGGGRANGINNEQVANTAIKFIEDSYIRTLRFQKETIKKIFNDSDDDTKTIINENMFKENNRSIKFLSIEMCLSRTSINNKKNKFIDRVYKLLK